MQAQGRWTPCAGETVALPERLDATAVPEPYYVSILGANATAGRITFSANSFIVRTRGKQHTPSNSQHTPPACQRSWQPQLMPACRIVSLARATLWFALAPVAGVSRLRADACPTRCHISRRYIQVTVTDHTVLSHLLAAPPPAVQRSGRRRKLSRDQYHPRGGRVRYTG